MMSQTWPMVPLGQLLSPISREESVAPDRQYDILGAHWYAKGLYTKETKYGSEIAASKVYRVEEGDFVYNRLFAWKGSFALATAENHGCYVSNEFPCFAIDRGRLEPGFVLHYFSRGAAWSEALGLSSGGTPTSRNRLKEAMLLRMALPLPPLPEQRRIVAKIEQLAAKIEEARGLRRRARLDEEALLPSVENASYGDIESSRWPIRDLESICSVFVDCDHRTPAYVDEGVPLLRPRDVRQGFLDVHGAVRIDRIDYERRCQRHTPSGRDIVYSRELSFGNAGFVPENTEVALGQGTLLVRACKKSVLDSYLLRILNSNVLRQQAVAAAKGAAHPHVNLKDIRQFCVPVPPLAEQHRIVAYLDALQAKVDSLKALQAQSAAELDALLPSILDKAFKGEV